MEITCEYADRMRLFWHRARPWVELGAIQWR
jgi:hypothetical protein